jgi:hypothetical protein
MSPHDNQEASAAVPSLSCASSADHAARFSKQGRNKCVRPTIFQIPIEEIQMANPINPDNSFATGVEATHIGPETGSTGSATMGGASGAGVSGNRSPATGSGMGRTLEEAERYEADSDEDRSFAPNVRTMTTADDIENPDAVKRTTDGE